MHRELDCMELQDYVKGWGEADTEAKKIELHSLGTVVPPMRRPSSLLRDDGCARLTSSELASAIVTSWKEILQVKSGSLAALWQDGKAASPGGYFKACAEKAAQTTETWEKHLVIIYSAIVDLLISYISIYGLVSRVDGPPPAPNGMGG